MGLRFWDVPIFSNLFLVEPRFQHARSREARFHAEESSVVFGRGSNLVLDGRVILIWSLSWNCRRYFPLFFSDSKLGPYNIMQSCLIPRHLGVVASDSHAAQSMKVGIALFPKLWEGRPTQRESEMQNVTYIVYFGSWSWPFQYVFVAKSALESNSYLIYFLCFDFDPCKGDETNIPHANVFISVAALKSLG